MKTRREVLAVYVRIRVPNTKLCWCHSRSKRLIGGLNPLLDSFTCICFSFVVTERPPEIAAVFWFYEKRVKAPRRVQENNSIFRAMKISIAPNCFQHLSFLILIIRSFICHPYEILKTNLHLIVLHFIRKMRQSLHRKLTGMLLAPNVPLWIFFLPS